MPCLSGFSEQAITGLQDYTPNYVPPLGSLYNKESPKRTLLDIYAIVFPSLEREVEEETDAVAARSGQRGVVHAMYVLHA